VNPVCRRLVALYTGPGLARELTPGDWEGIVRVARRSGLLARLGERLEEGGRLEDTPEAVRDHIRGARILAASHHRNIRWEVREIQAALRPRSIPFALLKGAAYVMAGLPAGRGRIFSDVDILVPEARLPEAERALEVHGWVTTHRHPYDQRYYRRWMHELPPMEHVHRGTSLDVHHGLLPRTASRHPDPERLWQAVRALPGWPGVWLLAPEDMVLHGAAHLFADGALENGLRDLTDLDALLRHFGQDPGFAGRLTRRGEELQLAQPLGDALHWCRELLGTAGIPEEVPGSGRGRLALASRGRDLLFRQGLRPEHPLCGGIGNGLARWLLYLRSHLLRMPLRRLLPHLARKGLRPAARQAP